MHHDEAYFPDFHASGPERGIPCQMLSLEQVEVAYRSFSLFSVASGTFAARGSAMLEISLTLARVICEYDFRLAEKEAGTPGIGKVGARNGRHRPEEFQLHTHVTSWSEGRSLEFRSRELKRDEGFE